MNEQYEQLIMTSMKMISAAGDGRNFIQEALEVMNQGNIEMSHELLKKAHEEIRIAHVEQTKILQAAMKREDEESATSLFTHAQDTLMTINSEYNLAVYLVQMMETLHERITKLERAFDEKNT